MRRVVVLILIGLFSSSLWGQDKMPEREKSTDREKYIAKIKKITELIDTLEGRNFSAKSSAKKELIGLGRIALPFLMEKVHQKDAQDYLEVILAINLQDVGLDTKDFSPFPIPKNEELERMVCTKTNEFVYSKYVEAVKNYWEGNYPRAYNISRSLLILEPGTLLRPNLLSLMMLAGQKNLQTTLIKADILVDKDFYELGEKIDFTLRLKNITDKKIIITRANPDEKGGIILKKTLTYYTHSGDEIYEKGDIVLETAPSITIEQQGIWEKKFVIDTEQDMQGPQVRLYTISAFIIPKRIRIEKDETIFEKIVFEPINIKIFPKGARKLRENSLANLKESLEKGIASQVFLSAALVSNHEKELAEEILMTYLPKSSLPIKQSIFSSLKYITGNTFGMDEEKWLKWWNEQKSGKSPKFQQKKSE